MAIVVIIFLFLLGFTSVFTYYVLSKYKKLKDFKLILVGGLFIMLFLTLLVLTTSTIFRDLSVSKNLSELGQHGDYVGGMLNPLIAVFAVFAAGFAFYAQYQANKQVQEQFEKQEKKDYVQNFENTFFNMLTIHHQIVQDMDYYLKSFYTYDNEDFSHSFDKKKLNDDKISKSRDVFKNSFRLLYIFMNEEKSRILGENIINYSIRDKICNLTSSTFSHYDKKIETKFNHIYKSIYIKYDSDFGHYFRNFYRLIKMVDEKKFSNNNVEDYKIKYSYTSIIRAQLSDSEIKWLFLNCLSDAGYKKFKPLIEKYSLLKIINLEDYLFKYFAMFYLNSAFDNPKSDEEIEYHLKINFYENDVFKPKFNYLNVKKVD
ncbi:MAG: hypothetical protein CVU07_00875 [Bacteroidetes bacterium HGW-Bacteroidetes-23]|nr:MAG: hypothetical protein CVU07_00875 [Bacteroidetes bacterium HGW-Bacteroidetes-23]